MPIPDRATGRGRSKDRRTRTVVTAGVLLAALLSAPSSPAFAADPVAPDLVAPASGATTSTNPTLSVTASDPDGGPLDVSFEGRVKGATVPGQSTENPFTIVVIPDTQNYTYGGRAGIITDQTQWIVDSRSQLNTQFVVHVGDLVSEFNLPEQWDAISSGMRVLDDAGIPNTVVPGNHDFDNATGAMGLYDTYFPVSRYSQASWNTADTHYGGYLGENQFGADPVDRQNMDSYALFRAGGRDFLVLNLEWEAPTPVLQWADRVLAAFPGRTAIMVTHSFLSIVGDRRANAERPGGTSQKALWDGFVSTHCQIRLVISGHEHVGDLSEASRTDPNACGQPVQQFMSDYQSRANGGNGWLRYYTFDPQVNTVTATTYSPTLGQYETDADSSFTVPFEVTPSQPAPFTTIGTASVTSGQTASITWPGRQADTQYEWRAVARDATGSATSATWPFRTGRPLASLTDTFTRTLAAGWGSTESGDSWLAVGPSTPFSVDGTAGRITAAAGKGYAIRSTAFTARDVSIRADVSMQNAPPASGTYASILGRVNGTGDYRVTTKFTPTSTAISLRKVIAGVETVLAAKSITPVVAVGTPLNVRFEVAGSPATLRVKAWTTGAEPTDWALSATDSTIADTGGVGAHQFTSTGAPVPVVVRYGSFAATELGDGAPNTPPTASIGAPTVSGNTVSLSGAGSTDSDGTISSWAWAFGDGATGAGATTSHTYASAATYTVTLTVTDNAGSTNSTTRAVTITPPPNQPPVAVIGTPGITGRAVSLVGSGSSDPDGTIASWAWDFGDGSTDAGATASHTYSNDGTFTVRLTVTDDRGASASATRSVTVTGAPASSLLADDFQRQVASGWGTSSSGAQWTLVGTASRYAVTGGVGVQTLAAAGSTETNAPAATWTNADVRVKLSWDRTSAAGAIYTAIAPRAVSAISDYRVKVIVSNNKPSLDLIRRVNGTETSMARVALPVTVSANTAYTVAIRITSTGGASTLAAKLWTTGTAEPTGWQVQVTDATAGLQAPGWLRLWSYLSATATTGVTTTFDDLSVVPPTP